VPQVSALLADPDPLIRESARRALQKNPAPEANAALRNALGSAGAPAWRAALLNALAERRDPSNLGPLLKEAAAPDDDVRTAAVIALAKLGDASGAAAIAAAANRGGPKSRTIAADSLARLADALAAKGEKAPALRIYRSMLAAGGHKKCAGLIGIGRAGTPAELPALFDALADPDARVRGACVEALALLQGAGVTRAVAAQIKASKPEARLAVLQALARRGDTSTAAVFLAVAEDADEAVRAEALAGLGTIGSASAVPLLVKAAAGEGKPQEAARQSLQRLPGGDVDRALLAALEEKEAKVRVEAIRALAARHAVAATRALLKSAADADASVRNEALKALGAVAPSGAMAAIAALLVKTEDDGARGEAAGALVRIADRDRDLENRAEPVLHALRSSSGPARFALLGVLGRIGGVKSLQGVMAAVKSPDEKTRDAAIRALAEWPDASAAEDLLAIAKSASSETHQVLALRGYLRVCRIRTDRPEAATAKMLAAGLQAARRADEKRQALGALAEVRDLLALQTVAPFLADEALREEAAHAAVRIGRDLWHSQPEAVQAAMQKVLAVSKNEGLKRDAQETLDRARQRLKETGAKK
jgi:HEAT repeat protein